MADAVISENVARYVNSLESYRASHHANHTSEECGSACEDNRPPHVSSPITPRERTTFGLIELLLKDQRRLDVISRDPGLQRELIPRLLSISLFGYAAFASVLAIIFSCARIWPELTTMATWLADRGQPLIAIVPDQGGNALRPWLDGSAFHLIAAFAFGLIAAIGVCLPSFYFYGLLAGIRTSTLHVTTNAMKGLASGAVAVLGALPIYLALMLGLVIFNAPSGLITLACFLGLALPFITGVYGTRSLYIGFLGLADTMPEQERCQRTCFLRRLLLAWSACYTAVTPVMIFALWEYLGR